MLGGGDDGEDALCNCSEPHERAKDCQTGVWAFITGDGGCWVIVMMIIMIIISY